MMSKLEQLGSVESGNGVCGGGGGCGGCIHMHAHREDSKEFLTSFNEQWGKWGLLAAWGGAGNHRMKIHGLLNRFDTFSLRLAKQPANRISASWEDYVPAFPVTARQGQPMTHVDAEQWICSKSQALSTW